MWEYLKLWERSRGPSQLARWDVLLPNVGLYGQAKPASTLAPSFVHSST